MTSRPTTPPTRTWPAVGAIVPTHNRPQLMQRAVQSIIDQDYEGVIEIVVVYDRSEVDDSVTALTTPGRTVRVALNDRTPGLAGARNTGILAAECDLIAFCDDDDTWLSAKLRTQVEALAATADAEFVTTAMVVDYDGRETVRLAGRNRVTHPELLRSRMAMLHSSSFLVRRAALLTHVGFVDETLPQSMAEDWDLLLRAAKSQPILHVDSPLVRIQWGATSYFAQQWELRNEARLWMIEHHPDIVADRLGAGLTYGKLAFGSAALGRRREALRWVRRTLRANWKEPRAYIALAVVTHLISWQRVVRELNKRGRGI